jgi:hypothetical protein
VVIEDVVRRQAGFKTRHVAFNAVQVGAIAAELQAIACIPVQNPLVQSLFSFRT